MRKTILVIGTFDTKDDELAYLIGKIKEQGGAVLTMDVSVLGDTVQPIDIPNMMLSPPLAKPSTV